MSTYVCVRKCIFRNRRWRVGEQLVSKKDEQVPAHFVPEPDFVEEAVPKEPRTFKEINDQRKAAKPKTGMAAKPKGKGKNKPEDPFE